MKLFKLTCILIFITVVLFYLSCRKQEAVTAEKQEASTKLTDAFFKLSDSSNEKIKAIASHLYRINQKKEFVTQLVKNAGYPQWDKALFASEKSVLKNNSASSGPDSTDVIFIPFVRPQGNTTSAILAVGGDCF